MPWVTGSTGSPTSELVGETPRQLVTLRWGWSHCQDPKNVGGEEGAP